MIRDGKGRIVRIERNENINTGHSACNICHEDMPYVWDTICCQCLHTHCYSHSVVINDRWYCIGCATMDFGNRFWQSVKIALMKTFLGLW